MKYTIDTASSTLKWTAEKLVGKHNGTINIKSGKIEIEDGKLLSGNFEVDMRTIDNTDIPSEEMKNKLVAHLKSADFFDIENHATATFKATSAENTGGTSYNITGDLTIKGITKPVSFAAEIKEDEDQVNAIATIKVDRTEYDIKFLSGKFFKDLGDKLVKDIFFIDLNLVAKK